MQAVQRFLADTRGIAAVEFALVLPLLLILYLGSVEAAALYVSDRKVATIAGSVADLVARQKEEVAASQVEDYFVAARSILGPLDTDGLVQAVSLLSIDSDGEARVVWSLGDGAMGREAGDLFELDADARISQMARNAGGWLVVGEASYPYRPLVGYVFAESVDLRHTEYYLPRIAGEIELDPDG